jgi:hypothetical protein
VQSWSKAKGGFPEKQDVRKDSALTDPHQFHFPPPNHPLEALISMHHQPQSDTPPRPHSSAEAPGYCWASTLGEEIGWLPRNMTCPKLPREDKDPGYERSVVVALHVWISGHKDMQRIERQARRFPKPRLERRHAIEDASFFFPRACLQPYSKPLSTPVPDTHGPRGWGS